MRTDYTHIAVVLDSSGSMNNILNDTIGGFNTFLKAHKEAAGEATFTLIEFAQPHSLHRKNWFGDQTQVCVDIRDNKTQIPVNVKYEFMPIKAVQELNRDNYIPCGATPLLDTIAETIIRTGISLSALPESLRPAKVLFVIITDGEENASRWYNHQRVMEMIQHQSIVYNWEFLYLGANQDAIQVGSTFGIAPTRSMSYGTSTVAIGQTYSTLATKSAEFRGILNVAAAKTALDFTEKERESVKDEK